jgi:two-component system, sensor histidine kinase and response regulator
MSDDITRSEIRYRGLFENMLSAAMVLSPHPDGFRIEAINPPCRRFAILGIDGRAVAWLHEVIDAGESPELHAALQHVLEQGIGIHLDEFALVRAGQTHWLDCHVFPLVSDEIGLMIRDVTDQKLTRDLRHAKEAAEQASELKSAFLASMSHEIRTPLNGVLSMVELLRGSRLNGRQRHWVEAIRSSGQLLLSTINDILDFSRIEAGRLQLETLQFSLGEIIGNLFNATFQRAYAKQLELVIHQDPELPDALIGDPFRIQQILVNLVGNAIKFTDQGEIEIRVTFRDLPDDRLELRVSVRDTGIGMGPDQVRRLFQPFEQIRANGWRFSEGTGLGLAICKRLVDAMDGEIAVESQLGRGSCFAFEIPLRRAEAVPSAGGRYLGGAVRRALAIGRGRAGLERGQPARHQDPQGTQPAGWQRVALFQAAGELRQPSAPGTGDTLSGPGACGYRCRASPGAHAQGRGQDAGRRHPACARRARRAGR